MITIDRTSGQSVHDQIVQQLRYLISSGQYRVGERLPSTRALGKQLDVSFHTVRKAYQALEQAGMLIAQPGSGFEVRAHRPLAKDVRMERGATMLQSTLRSMVGLGLSAGEIDLLFQEQLDVLGDENDTLKLVATASYAELAQLCSARLHEVLQRTVEAIPLDQLDQHRDADYVFAPLVDVRTALQRVPRAEVLGLHAQYVSDGFEPIARLSDHETLGLFTIDAPSLAPLSQFVRDLTGFKGQVVGTSFNHRVQNLEHVLRQIDFVLYTPTCTRYLKSMLPRDLPRAELALALSETSLATIRQQVPS